MKRRNFLSLAGITSGSCLISSSIARRIHEVCIGASQPLVLAPENYSLELYAEESYGNYLLHLGDPEEEPEYPTYREFIERQGFDTENRRSLRDYLINWRCHDVQTDGLTKYAIDELMSNLDEPIDGYERNHWMEWDFELHDGTLPSAYHYLLDLPLDDGNPSNGFELGSLSFIEGDRPGSNLTYVEADNLATIASLQHRLNELKTGAIIHID